VDRLSYAPSRSCKLDAVADVDDLLPAALSLPASERARLARELIESLDEATDENATELWAKEIERRVNEIRSGSVEIEDWETVRARIRRRLSERSR
jgi:putative addiction module component (TIGR02574 family)